MTAAAIAMTVATEAPTYSTSDLYLSAHRSLPSSASSSQPSISPRSLSFLSSGSPLPPIPSDFPRSKLIPSTRFVVDGFRRAGDHSVSYFLSHFHSDHYSGLSPSWLDGVVFCSDITARLLVDVLGVPSCFVVALPLEQTVSVDGCEVNLIDANHCPGAVQFLFTVTQEDGTLAKYIHTGDFRFCESMKSLSKLLEFIGCDAVFLDTTYCNPKFMFPPQQESIDYVVSVIDRIGAENVDTKDKKNVLFVVATYVIGKEKILVEISKRCGRKIFVDGRKRSVLRALGYVDDNLFTEDESATNIRVVGWNVLGETWPYFRPNFVNMKKIMEESGYAKIVGFVPTGWTYEVKRNKFSVRTKDSFEIHLVPYSEHSNYEELREYIRFLKPKRVIPTVGMNIEKGDSKHVMKMQKHFAGLVDETANKHTFLMGFKRTSIAKDEDDHIINSDASVEDRERVTSKTAPDIGPGSSTSMSPASKRTALLNEEDKEDILQQLNDCLPVWVTRDLLLELIDTVGTNVVEILSYFYEHETKFHDRSGAHTASLVLPEDNSSVTKSKGLLHEVIEVKKIQKPNPLLKLKPTTGSIISPKKRKGNQGDKAKKKTRSYSDPKASGIKQSTITTFFTKMQPCATQFGTVSPDQGEFPEKEDTKPGVVPEQYKQEFEQLMCVINGSNESQSSAASAIVKAKGDINLALDMYYGDLECKVDVKFDPVSKPILSEGCQQYPYLSPGKVISVAPVNSSHANVKDLLKENTEAVALPLETYSQKPACSVETCAACWRVGQPAPYLHLARTFELVEREKGRIKATSMLCNMFRSLLALAPEDVLLAVYLCTNKIAADHENMELNIGGSLVSAALEDACGTNKLKLREMYNNFGDLGDVAQECRQTQSLLIPPSPLLIKDVFSTLQKISLQRGNGSTSRKKNLIVGLMRSCREKEIKYLVRTLVRNLRIGAMMRTILPALAEAVVMNSCARGSENFKEMFQRLSAAVVDAYNIVPNLDVLIPSFMKEGVNFSSNSLTMVPGIPIKPMLAKITNGVSQVLKSLKKKAFTCEYKYDGQRAQIHKLADGSVRVFSRNGDETTQKFPDVVHTIQDAYKPSSGSFVLDAELVAVDRKNGFKLLSFQELSSRERGVRGGSSVAVDNIKVDVCVYLFDAMLVNGEQMLDCALRKRRKYLRDLFGGERPGYLEYANELTVEADEACEDNVETLLRMNAFFEKAFLSSCEGIMVKTLDIDAGYYPSKRADTWLKVKRDYVEGLNDSLDLVPIGAWYGNGRKAGWYSPFLMACYNPDTEEFESVCRVMSGFSDMFYTEMKEFFSEEKILTKKPPYYRTNESPDKWFPPELVWQIKGADFTVSPVHHAAVGIVHPSRGISVRFPRFVCSATDRRPEDCCTSSDIAEMFHSQTRKMDTTTN